MTDKDLIQKIAEISWILGKSKKFSMNLEVTIKDFYDGVQVNWVGSGHSFMWRSVQWDKEMIELFTGNDIVDMFVIKEIV